MYTKVWNSFYLEPSSVVGCNTVIISINAKAMKYTKMAYLYFPFPVVQHQQWIRTVIIINCHQQMVHTCKCLLLYSIPTSLVQLDLLSVVEKCHFLQQNFWQTEVMHRAEYITATFAIKLHCKMGLMNMKEPHKGWLQTKRSRECLPKKKKKKDTTKHIG